MPQSTVPKVHVSPFMVVSLALDSVPLGDPWLQIKTGILLVGTIVLVVWVTRLTLWQRDEYWRERGRDPKHPQRLREAPAEEKGV